MHHLSFTQTDLGHKSLEYVSTQGPCDVSLLGRTDKEMFLLVKIHTIPFMYLALR